LLHSHRSAPCALSSLDQTLTSSHGYPTHRYLFDLDSPDVTIYTSRISPGTSSIESSTQLFLIHIYDPAITAFSTISAQHQSWQLQLVHLL
ncbi:hypothetical protein F5887DRAFT_1143370, partial [Amanita rubescens]